MNHHEPSRHEIGNAKSVPVIAGNGAHAPTEASLPSHAGGGDVQWTCPMHPQIVRDQAGSCPICGMALEPRTISAEVQQNPELTDMSRRFWTATALTTPLVLIAMGELIMGHGFARL